MENKEEKECCKTGSCGCGKSCCCARGLAAVVLLLLGGIIGYLIGGNCHGKGWKCPMMPMSAPMTPPAK